jgi:hypothetical protein
MGRGKPWVTPGRCVAEVGTEAAQFAGAGTRAGKFAK